MLYIFLGDDVKNKKISYEKFLASLPRNIEFSYLNRNNFDKDRLEAFYSCDGLFFNICAVFLDNLLEREETRNFILKKLDLISKSKNYFIFYEVKLNKPILEAFYSSNANIKIFELPKQKKEKYDNFLIANSFAAKNKLLTWIHFRRAIDLGVSLEEITGVVFWKIKDMLLKKNFGKFNEEELKNSANKLAYLLPKSRKKGIEAESSLERFFLETL